MTKTGCLICGEELKYGEFKEYQCSICGGTFQAQEACIKEHYVCDNCHSDDPLEYLENYVNNTEDKNPFEMLVRVMQSPSFNMHGPEHHYLIPAVFLTAIKNNGYEVPDNYWQLVLAHGSDLPGGTCGYWGACAAAIGNGVTASILKECAPIKKEYYGEIHGVTADSLNEIAKIGGPRCCKRNVFLSAYL